MRMLGAPASRARPVPRAGAPTAPPGARQAGRPNEAAKPYMDVADPAALLAVSDNFRASYVDVADTRHASQSSAAPYLAIGGDAA
jgi:hypothetical protein